MHSITKAVRFCSARCGAGKTRAALQQMAQHEGRYIYAVDRREVAEDRRQTIYAEAIAAGLHAPMIETVFSDTGNHGAGKGIATLIAEAITRCERLDHAIIIVTHQGLQMTRHHTFGDRRWTLLIDETPDIFEMRSMDTGPLMIPFLQAHYELQDDGAIDLVRPIPAREFEREAMRPYRQFHDLVKRGGARASVTSWAETADPWWISRCWDATILDLFDSVTVFADSFPETITYNVLKSQGVRFEEVYLADHRVWRDRRVTISYYVNDHEASGTKFKDAAVKVELRKIAAHLSSLKVNDHLWTTNAEIASVFAFDPILGDRVTPKQAGSNRWSTWHDATMIYAARPSPDEILIHARHGMTEDDLVKARGGYDIKQFAMRLSLRDPASTAPVTVRVYDEEQALALKEYLDTAYGFECEVEKIDVGIMVAKKKRGRPVSRSAEDQKALRSIYNARAYEKRKKNIDVTISPLS